MKAAPLWRVSVLTGADAEDAVGDLLLTIFQQTASSYTDADTGLTETSVYVSDASFAPRELRRQIAGGLKRIRSCGLKTDPGEIFFRRVKREDWALSWRRHFKPLAIGSALLVKPPWSRRRARKGQAVVVLNPGLSFGTGQHPTTEFCLRQLAAAVTTIVDNLFWTPAPAREFWPSPRPSSATHPSPRSITTPKPSASRATMPGGIAWRRKSIPRNAI